MPLLAGVDLQDKTTAPMARCRKVGRPIVVQVDHVQVSWPGMREFLQ